MRRRRECVREWQVRVVSCPVVSCLVVSCHVQGIHTTPTTVLPPPTSYLLPPSYLPIPFAIILSFPRLLPHLDILLFLPSATPRRDPSSSDPVSRRAVEASIHAPCLFLLQTTTSLLSQAARRGPRYGTLRCTYLPTYLGTYLTNRAANSVWPRRSRQSRATSEPLGFAPCLPCPDPPSSPPPSLHFSPDGGVPCR
ncbi:hypothetical protein LY76DRAFT_110830 [Colletotrichum caudatum]|nr:hypothetical protein LY76DRAFT_110830 [Colletotrichum caudatum]